MQKVTELSQRVVPEKARGIRDHNTFDLSCFQKEEGEDHYRYRKVNEFV